MKIIVCIKQVPETFEVKIDPETKRIVREGVKSIINPYDMYAIEEGIRLKERFGGEVVAITMGPPHADGILECKRLMEDHYETLKIKMPVLITVVKEINEPRIPSLKGMLKAKKTEIPVWSSENLNGEEDKFGQDGSPTRVVDVWTQTIKKEGRIVEGEPEKLAEEIFNELKNLGAV